MAAILTNGVLKIRAHLSAAVGAGALQGLWEHKGSRCTPANAAHSPPRRAPAPGRARHPPPTPQPHSHPTHPPPPPTSLPRAIFYHIPAALPVTPSPLPPPPPPHPPSTGPPSAPPGKAPLAHEPARAVLKENPLPHRQPMAGTSFPARGNFHPSHH